MSRVPARAQTMLVFAASSLLAIVFTWPLVTNLRGAVVPDAGDQLLNTWILWWNSAHVPLTAAWWNAPAYFPAEGVLAFSEHLLGLSPVTSPLIWLSGSPVLAHNVMLILTFSLSATAAYLLGLEITGRRDAALLAGIAFGFAPYRLAHLAHIQVLASFWMPIALLALHRYARSHRARDLVLFGAAFLLQSLTNGYFMLFLPLLIALWCVWFIRPRQWRTVVGIALAGVAAVAVLVPFLLKYREIHAAYGLSRTRAATLEYSADVASVLHAPPWSAFWGDLQLFYRAEGDLFPGLTVVLLVVAGLVVVLPRHLPLDVPWTARSTLGFYAVGALAMFAFALGPSPTLMGERFLPFGPYEFLMWLPGFDGLRVPARFAMLMALCLAAAAAVGFAVLTAAWSRRWQWLITGVVAAGLVVDSWPARLPLVPLPRVMDIGRHEVSGALLILPMRTYLDEVVLMYQSIGHGKPIVNGYSGYGPPWYRGMRARLDRFDPTALDALADAGVTQIAVVVEFDSDGDVRRYVGTRARHVRTTADGVALYDLIAREPDSRAGAELPIQSIQVSEHDALIPSMTDWNNSTFWHSRPQQGGEFVVIDLGAAHRVARIETSLGRFPDAYPREAVIEISVDGIAWQEVWRGAGESRLLDLIFEPRSPPRLGFPVGGRDARYLRMSQIGRAEQSTWTIAELAVRAPLY